MKFIDLLEEDSMLINYHFISKKRLFEQVGQLLGHTKSEGLTIYHSLLAREKLGNTSLGTGIAIPHGKCLEPGDIRVCLIKLSQHDEYDSIANEPVSIINRTVISEVTNLPYQRLLKEPEGLFRHHVLHEEL